MLRTKTNVRSTYALEHIQGFHLRDPNIALKLSCAKFHILLFEELSLTSKSTFLSF